MICGACKDPHATVAEVRACYEGPADDGLLEAERANEAALYGPNPRLAMMDEDLAARHENPTVAQEEEAQYRRNLAAAEAMRETHRVNTDERYSPPEPTGEVERCGQCGGTGRFITGSLNGRLVGPGGPCFRCSGKGVQTDADRTRNYWYDAKYRRIYI